MLVGSSARVKDGDRSVEGHALRIKNGVENVRELWWNLSRLPRVVLQSPNHLIGQSVLTISIVTLWLALI